ncbi:transglutaminase [Mesorhizobium sp. L-8-10]|uniref:transglutaminase-like cysteine peptidase n=1 Tax=unclassified Mesorhizobium TaxID=325217 RepID=UPI0019386AA3|nr:MULTISPECIES: transglutaminase-like cysteine peptidase [unclassified Mesorhizobium]BCH21315.1 transglutaminase [Mesorhizobium sp. L-8-3]BCH29160.1 transglutaminase [Mesorhizobium sp. L-8-10]
MGLVAGLLSAAAAVAAPMATGGLTSQPIGHFEFCKANPAECDIRFRDIGPEQMTNALWQEIGDINLSVNKSVKPMNDVDLYGKDEVWAYPDGAGDCEDYVLEKRRELNAKGISLSNLLITVVRKPDGEGHAVLTVRTDKGDFILDNLTNKVRPWDDTGYRYLKRQSSEHTGRWVSIREGQTTMVGAVQ